MVGFIQTMSLSERSFRSELRTKNRVSTDGYPSRCPSSRSPHGIRRGSITYHLTQETSPEVASERMDVSLEILYKHYDVRDEREKMGVRKDNIPDI